MAVRQMDQPRMEAVWFQLPKENPAVPVTVMHWALEFWSGLRMRALHMEGCFQNNWTEMGSVRSTKVSHRTLSKWHCFSNDCCVTSHPKTK